MRLSLRVAKCEAFLHMKLVPRVASGSRSCPHRCTVCRRRCTVWPHRCEFAQGPPQTPTRADTSSCTSLPSPWIGLVLGSRVIRLNASLPFAVIHGALRCPHATNGTQKRLAGDHWPSHENHEGQPVGMTTIMASTFQLLNGLFFTAGRFNNWYYESFSWIVMVHDTCAWFLNIITAAFQLINHGLSRGWWFTQAVNHGGADSRVMTSHHPAASGSTHSPSSTQTLEIRLLGSVYWDTTIMEEVAMVMSWMENLNRQ